MFWSPRVLNPLPFAYEVMEAIAMSYQDGKEIRYKMWMRITYLIQNTIDSSSNKVLKKQQYQQIKTS